MNRKKIITLRAFGLALALAVASLVAVSTQDAPALGASGNLLTNAGMESGTTGWTVFGAGAVASSTSPVHGGTRSLSRTGRTASWNGPAQNVTSVLTNNSSYTASVWMRVPALVAGLLCWWVISREVAPRLLARVHHRRGGHLDRQERRRHLDQHPARPHAVVEQAVERCQLMQAPN